MKKLLVALFQSEAAREEALLQAEQARNNRIANTLEKMIVSGRYRGLYMCHTLDAARKAGEISKADHIITTNHILSCLNYDSTAAGFISSYLGSYDPYYRDVINSPFYTEHFERRIVLSNFYWNMIRLLRSERTTLETLINL
ncbi:hypothetical protein [Pseudomonas phage D6]|nr:hypothetical protein [Pseudomonas phage D6]